MIDRAGNQVGYSYKDLKTLRRFVIDTNTIGSEILIDPETGQKLSRQYSKIRTEVLHIIAINSIGGEILLDPETGQELSRQFKRIRFVGTGYEGEDSTSRIENIKP